MQYHEKTGYPIVESIDELKEAEKQGYIFVHARCPICKKTFLSIIPNAYTVIVKGCVLCRMGEIEDEQSD